MTNTACPTSRHRVDARSARIAALIVTGIAVSAVFGATPWLLVTLAVDFALKGFLSPKLSIIGQLADLIRRVVGLSATPVDAAPKMFAAKLGFTFAAIAAVASFAALPLLATIAAASLGACAFLEGSLGFCVGCRIYGLFVHRLGALKPNPDPNP